MSLPSEDQSVGPRKSGDFIRRSSAPTPVAAFSYMLEGPARSEPNTRRSPSGDHNGPQFALGSAVSRERTPLVALITQTLWVRLAASKVSTATCLSSGDRATL